MTDMNFHDEHGSPLRYLVRRNHKWHRSILHAASLTFWFPSALYAHMHHPVRALVSALAAVVLTLGVVLFRQLTVIVVGLAGYLTDTTQDECGTCVECGLECQKKKKHSATNQPTPTHE